MKRILILVIAMLSAKMTLAQWTTSGSNIYNSNSGNVGIGTTTPSDKLDIQNGGIRLQRLPASLTGGDIYGQIFQLQNLVGNADGLVYQADLHQFRNYDGTPEFTINNGNVGIGTSSPQQKLDVIGRIKLRSDNSSSAGIWFTDTNGAQTAFLGQTDQTSAGSVGIYHSGDWRFIVNSSGSVGIGTLNPQQKIDVIGRIKLRADNSSSAGIWFTDTNGVQTAFLGQTDQTSAGSLGIYHSGDWRFIVNSNGNVGIGTFSPDAKLAVKGTIHAEEVKVDLSVPGPDYVFEKDYNLMSLEEIKAYIEKHKHLPEVPSAKEMETNGVNLSEMNMILLKKVEELTLYLIEKDKEIQILKKDIKTIKNEK
jgi:hypothetical protein